MSRHPIAIGREKALSADSLLRFSGKQSYKMNLNEGAFSAMCRRRNRHYEKAFSANEAISLARSTCMKDCFVVPPRNDDFYKNHIFVCKDD